MAVPILDKRRARKQLELQSAIDAGIEKALSPAIAAAGNGVSGATYGSFSPSSPFAQTAGNVTGSVPLPRPASDFGSLFGPGTPFTPDPIDFIRADGRTDPRRYQYSVTENLQLGQFGAPWGLLRSIASDVDVVSRLVELVQDALSGMDWSFGFSRQIINQIRLENNEPNSAKATALAREKYGEELSRVQKFWERPDEKMGYTFSQWLTLAIWAQQVYDGIVVHPSYTLKGDLHSLSLLDTSTIKLLLDNQGFPPQAPAPAYQQILYGFSRSEFQAENVNDDGTIPNGYRNDQLAYYIRRPRLHTLYGFSPVEECINYATLYQQRQEWMHANWSHGVTPRGVIKTTGTEGWTPEQLSYYGTALNDQWSGQTQRRQQVMVLRPGMEWEQLKDFAELYNTNLDEWLVLQLSAKFGVPQQQMGIPMRSYLHSGAQNTTSMDLTDKFALDSLANFMVDCINDLTRRFMGVGPEITMTATSGNTDASDLQRAQADASDVNSGIRTRNEVRAERGAPLISDTEADQLSVIAGNELIFLSGQLELQAAEARAIEDGQTPMPAPGGSANAGQEAQGETSNRTVGHISPTDMAIPSGQKEPSGSATPSDRGSYSEKELAAFAKFAKSRLQDGKTYRPFEFRSVGPRVAAILNSAGASGDYDAVKTLIDAIKAIGPRAAGISVRAADSGRVLMLQRALDDTDPASGKFEFPGGKIEDGESSYEAATREWQEETGSPLPAGNVVGEWLSPNGVYQGYVYEIPSESDVSINTDPSRRSVLNPDDPDGDGAEIAAWFDPKDLPGNSALRSEVLLTPWATLTQSATTKSKQPTEEAIIDYSGRVILPKPLKAGDRIVIEHKNGKDDELDLEDVEDLD